MLKKDKYCEKYKKGIPCIDEVMTCVGLLEFPYAPELPSCGDPYTWCLTGHNLWVNMIGSAGWLREYLHVGAIYISEIYTWFHGNHCLKVY